MLLWVPINDAISTTQKSTMISSIAYKHVKTKQWISLAIITNILFLK